jgi:hypothetical protein
MYTALEAKEHEDKENCEERETEKLLSSGM